MRASARVTADTSPSVLHVAAAVDTHEQMEPHGKPGHEALWLVERAARLFRNVFAAQHIRHLRRAESSRVDYSEARHSPVC